MQLNVALLAPIGMIYHDPFDGVQTQTIFFCQNNSQTWLGGPTIFDLNASPLGVWIDFFQNVQSQPRIVGFSIESWDGWDSDLGHPDFGTLEKGIYHLEICLSTLVASAHLKNYWSKWESFPQIGMKIQLIWNHHLVVTESKKKNSLKTPVNTCEPSIGFIDRFLAPGHRTAASSICWYRPLAIDPSGVGQWKHEDVGICCRLLLQSRDWWFFALFTQKWIFLDFSTMLLVKPAILPTSSACCEYQLYTKKNFYPLIQAFGNPQPE